MSVKIKGNISNKVFEIIVSKLISKALNKSYEPKTHLPLAKKAIENKEYILINPKKVDKKK